MRTIQVRLPDGDMAEIDRLVFSGSFKNRSEAVREAVKIFLSKYRYPSEVTLTGVYDRVKMLELQVKELTAQVNPPA